MIMHDNGDDDDDDDEDEDEVDDDDDDDDDDGSLRDAKQLQICLLPTLCCGGCSLSQNCQRRFFFRKHSDLAPPSAVRVVFFLQ